MIQGDILKQDLSEASVVTVYLLPKSLGKLRPLLQRELKKGEGFFRLMMKSLVGGSPNGLRFRKTPVEGPGACFCTKSDSFSSPRDQARVRRVVPALRPPRKWYVHLTHLGEPRARIAIYAELPSLSLV